MFSDHALVNYSNMTRRRIRWVIGLEYRTTSEQLRAIRAAILTWLDSDPRFVTEIDEVPNIVHVEGFNDSSIDMLIYCFTETTRWYDWLSAKEDLALAIKQIVEEAGAGFAFPSRSVYIEQGGVGEVE
jgi:MscS family membrane protein